MRTYGPVAVGVYADNSWMSYQSGIVDCGPASTTNHAVTVVGWNQEGNYYRIKK